LVSVSFVEYFQMPDEPGEKELLEQFPPRLAQELQRQKAWSRKQRGSPD
jgi:hypothetical protein